MRSLVPCPRCKRHVRAAETSCPHCGHSNGALTFAAIAAAASLAIAGCGDPAPVAVYGPPPVDPSQRAVPTSDATGATDVPTTPAPVYGPAPVDPTARTPDAPPTATSTASGSPTSAATSTASGTPTSALTGTTTPTKPPIRAVYGPPPPNPKERKPDL